jgi:hypothetical protein
MSYSIQTTGMSGSFAIRYEYETEAHHYFGYADTLEEAEAILKEAGVYE